MNPEHEAENILKSKDQEELEFYKKHTILMGVENNKILKEIEETAKLTEEVNQQYDLMFRGNVAEGLHRNEVLIKVEYGLKSSTDWLDELIAMLKEDEEHPPTIPLVGDLEPHIAEMTVMIENLKSSQSSNDFKASLERETSNLVKIISDKSEVARSLLAEKLAMKSEKNQILNSLETVLTEKMKELLLN